MADLRGVLAKLRRADEHRQAFDRLLEEFLDKDPYSIAFDFDADTGWNTFRWVVRHDPPLTDFALIEGDFLTNLRGTLDYLVWQLVLASGSQPTEKTAFPVVKESKYWAGAAGGRLSGVDPIWVTEIEKLQPYHGQQRGKLHPLALIDNLNNINKHRTLPATIVDPMRVSFQIDVGTMAAGDQIRHEFFAGEPIEHGAVLMRFMWVQTRQQLNVNVDGDLSFRASFRDGLNHDWTNDEAFDWVSRAVAIFEPAFPSQRPALG